MNSRERVKKVINHEIPDKIPVDFGGTPSTSISPISYHKLRKELGLKNKLFYIPNFVFQSVYPEDEILEKFNIDIIDVGRAFIESIDWKIWKLNDDIECFIPSYIDLEINPDGDSLVKNKDGFVVAKKRKGSLYFDQCSFPYENLDSIPIKFNDFDLRKTTTNYWNIPIMPLHLDVFEKSQNDIFVNTIKNLYEKSDKAISLLVGCPLMEEGKSLRGVENFYCDIYKDQKGTERLMDTLLDRYLELLTRLLEGVGKYINILRFADDLGFQEGPIISPEKYREIFKPRHKKMWDLVHRYSDCAVSLHSCGSVFKLIPDFIDAGLNILNPVQTSAKDMEAEKLKREFGRDIVFWGGCGDTQNVLVFGNPKEVEKDTRDRIKKLGKDGGLIFATINAIQQDVPPENIIAMFNTVNEFNLY